MVKDFKSYEEQVELLAWRGMDVGKKEDAVRILKNKSYYRLSGYWHPFKRTSDEATSFIPGTKLSDVVRLYDFDQRLRVATFNCLSEIEVGVRSLLGYHLGEVDPCAHLLRYKLSARANGEQYDEWLEKYKVLVDESREPFVVHHREKYNGVLPVWAAVEVLHWGELSRLYNFSPDGVQLKVSSHYGLTRPQLGSWLKCLNVVRNVCAHHGRMFNRSWSSLQPKLPSVGKIKSLDVSTQPDRTFRQLTLIQHLLDVNGSRSVRALPAVMRSYPNVPIVKIERTGAPEDWENLPLWRNPNGGI